MASDVEFCRTEDMPQLFELFADWYRHNPRLREQDYFDWQFRNTPIPPPDGQEYNFLVLRDGPRIVGCLGYSAFEYMDRGEQKLGAWTHNWHVAKGQNDGGLKLLSRYMQLFDNRFMLRINDNSGGVFQLFRIPILERMPRLCAFPDAGRAAAYFGFDLGLAKRSETVLAGLPAPCAVEVTGFEDGEDFSLDHWPDTDGWVRRSGRYLNWRYRDIPRHNYRFLRGEGGVGVFRVETIMGGEETVVRLVDWTFPRDQCAGALAGLMQAIAPSRPILIDFCCTHHGIVAALADLGFVDDVIPVPPIPDLFRPLNRAGGIRIAIDLPPHRIAREFPFSRWYITTGESDIDRIKL